MTAALLLVVLVSLPFIAILVRRPVLRRLALRNAVRRPREAALVVLGSLLGAAIITGSAVVGDTMDASIRQVARTHLGPIDELVTVREPRPNRLSSSACCGRSSRATSTGSSRFATIEAAVTSTGPRVRTAPRSQLLSVDFEQRARLRRRCEATGIDRLDPDDRSRCDHRRRRTRACRPARADGSPSTRTGLRTTLLVDRVLPRRGVAGFWLGAEQEAHNVLVSPKTFDVIRAGGGRRHAADLAHRGLQPRRCRERRAR